MRMERSGRGAVRIGAAALMVAAAAVVAVWWAASAQVRASEPRATVTVHDTVQPAGAAPAFAGEVAAMQVVIDDESGALRPAKAGEIPALDMQESSRGLEAVMLRDGTVGLKLQGRYLNLSTAQVTAGQAHTACVDDPQAAQALLEGEEVRDDR